MPTLIELLKRVARSVLEQASTYRPVHREALEIARLERYGPPTRVRVPGRRNLDAVMSWIKRAQTAAGDSGGVAWGYRARAPIRSTAPLGWIGPYPETTGYIIPTMLRYAATTGDASSTEAARKMADWEVRIQLTDGGFQGGIYGSQPVSSSTFVTGQVIFGLIEAYRKWHLHAYRDAAVRAGNFLLDCLDENGRFVKGYSHFCAPGPKAYEVRTGLALAELGLMLEENIYKQAASRMADYAISRQQRNGWFCENDLNNHDVPLTHTIGYVLEGLHGIGTLLNRPDCIEATRCTLDRITKLVRADGFLAGRWRSDWSPGAEWACLTGSAQIAGVCLRMHREFGNAQYLDAASRLLGFLCWTQETKGESSGLAGSISGSYPFGGEYGQWSALNWAAKFFADSLMDFLETVHSTEARS